MSVKDNHGYHMPPQEFRRHGYALIDWLADYALNVDQYPVLSQVKPGDVRATLPQSAPQIGESFEQVMADFERDILPGITHWQSPNFFAYFPANTSGPSILGELLSAGLGVQGMMWLTSPACTELESHVLDWVVDILGYPRNSSPVPMVVASFKTLHLRRRFARCSPRANGSLALMQRRWGRTVDSWLIARPRHILRWKKPASLRVSA